MELSHLKDMIGGWIVGDFSPSILKSSEFEVAVKHYKAGDYEKEHFHKIAEEITLILSGRVKMFNQEFLEGDIIHIKPGESTGFLSITDSITVVVKKPSVIGDKYFI